MTDDTVWIPNYVEQTNKIFNSKFRFCMREQMCGERARAGTRVDARVCLCCYENYGKHKFAPRTEYWFALLPQQMHSKRKTRDTCVRWCVASQITSNKNESHAHTYRKRQKYLSINKTFHLVAAVFQAECHRDGIAVAASRQRLLTSSASAYLHRIIAWHRCVCLLSCRTDDTMYTRSFANSNFPTCKWEFIWIGWWWMMNIFICFSHSKRHTVVARSWWSRCSDWRLDVVVWRVCECHICYRSVRQPRQMCAKRFLHHIHCHPTGGGCWNEQRVQKKRRID